MIITSCHNSILIQALEESINNNDGLDCKTPVDWVRHVGYETDLRSAALSTARAGRELNKIAYQQTGEYDRIGNNFTHWKEHEKYQVFPPNFNPTTPLNMTNSSLNKEFLPESAEREVNEDLLFNTALLEECRLHSPRIEVDLNKYGGTLASPDLNLYDLGQIHPVGKPLWNQKTNNCDYPNGLQIRSNMITDRDTVDKFVHIISQKKWDPRRDQIILIILPEEYQYWTEIDGERVKVIYGIIDGNHRIDGVTKQLEEFIIAWLIDMPLKKIRKYGNAICNRDDNVVRGRADEDIVDSIVLDLKDKTTDLYKATAEAQKGEDQDQNNISVDNIWRKEIDEYNVHPNKAEAILRKLKWADHGVAVGRKPWDEERIKTFIKDNKTDCSGWTANTDKESLYDYDAPGDRKIIVCQAEGKNHVLQAARVARLLRLDPKCLIEIYFALAKKDKPTEDTLPILRERFIKKFYEVFEDFREGGGNLTVRKVSPRPRMGFLPENARELQGKRFIERL